MKLSYVQIGCRNYKRLADFYKRVCDFKDSNDNSWLRGQEGVVLEACGIDDDKTIYFGFVPGTTGTSAKINDIGFAHTCYETVDVKAAVKRLVKYGGTFQSTMKNPYNQPCVYCKDIEGNVVEFHIPFISKDTNAFVTITSLLHFRKDKEIKKESGNSKIKFIHVNIISEDYRSLCDYYNSVFASEDTGKLKDHSGKFKESVIGIKDVHVVGQHVLLPGFYASYPTLEIFTYNIKGRTKPCDLNSLGINVIGFDSFNIKKDLRAIVKNGGKIIKEDEEFNVVFDKQEDYLIIRNRK